MAGLVAQVDAPPANQVGQVGVYAGITYLVIEVIRQGTPPLIELAKIRAASREERVRMAAQRASDEREIAELKATTAELKARLAETDERARRAENEVENAKLIADARSEAIEKRTREVGHMVRNNAQRIQNVEQIVGGSDEKDPESAL
jgi:hypothetical protein